MTRLVVVVFTLAVAAAESGRKCTPYAVFKDDCNTCLCSSDGMNATCTDRPCPLPNNISYKKTTNATCEPKSKFKDHCNECKCAEDGLSYSCTNFKCNDNLNEKDVNLNSELKESNKEVDSARQKICKPNTTFYKSCNLCWCSADGYNAKCTLKDCKYEEELAYKTYKNSLRSRRKRENKICEPRSISSLDGVCNICICNENGTGRVCTNIQCTSKYIEETRTREPWGEPYNEGEFCVPNRPFYNECNLCVCRSNAYSAVCEINPCEENT